MRFNYLVFLFLIPCIWAQDAQTTTQTTLLHGKLHNSVGRSDEAAHASPLSSNSTTSKRPSSSQSLLYGLLATTIVNLAALLGLVFTPAHHCGCYPILISFMVATAVASLFSTSILVLIPEAFGLVNDPDASHDYVYPAITVCIGSFAFFILEFLLRRLRTCIDRNSHSSHLSNNEYTPRLGEVCELNCGVVGDIEVTTPSSVAVVNGELGGPGPCRTKVDRFSIKSSNSNEIPEKITLCGPDTCRRIAGLDPVVWMIVIGDGMHNFMDGLSMGAGFAIDLRLGFSLTLAILCEEIPHELGDIAILLRSGLSVGMAVLFNFSSACTAYLGFFVGLYLGELSNAATYIFALTAGFFLYIGLADMLPEMRKTEDERMRSGGNTVGIFFIHSFGLMFGFGCILTITLLNEYLTL